MQICRYNANYLHNSASRNSGARSVNTMLKRDRQKKILNLVRAKPIGTQEALREQLERTGVSATQSSVSRDLEELGIVKHDGRYSLPHSNGDLTRGLVAMDVAGDVLIVARGLAGRASAVAG